MVSSTPGEGNQSPDDRTAHLGEDHLETAQMGTSHTGVSSPGGEEVSLESALGLDTVDQLTDDGLSVVDLAGDQQFWRFGHVIVDEAQDLTPMQWRMINRRTQGGSITIVGDRAQRTAGPVAEWPELLGETIGDVSEVELSVNYRSPTEVNDVAAAVLQVAAPGVKPTTSIRSSGFEPDAISLQSRTLKSIAVEELSAVDGTVAIILPDGSDSNFDLTEISELSESRLSVLSPAQSKGMEFDSVIVVEPSSIVGDVHGPTQLYVACTRSTNRLRFAYDQPMPAFLATVLAEVHN